MATRAAYHAVEIAGSLDQRGDLARFSGLDHETGRWLSFGIPVQELAESRPSHKEAGPFASQCYRFRSSWSIVSILRPISLVIVDAPRGELIPMNRKTCLHDTLR
jgi:hypothetical protein